MPKGTIMTVTITIEPPRQTGPWANITLRPSIGETDELQPESREDALSKLHAALEAWCKERGKRRLHASWVDVRSHEDYANELTTGMLLGGEPLAELDTTTHGSSGDLLERVRAVAVDRGLSVEVVPSEEWTHGDAAGIYQHDEDAIEVEVQSNEAEVARVAVHELAHAVLHEPTRSDEERPRRELEAEATAYVVARHYGLDAENSRFYLAAWANQDDEDIRERLDRIQSTASRLIESLDDALESNR